MCFAADWIEFHLGQPQHKGRNPGPAESRSKISHEFNILALTALQELGQQTCEASSVGRTSSATTDSSHSYGKGISRGPKGKIHVAPDSAVLVSEMGLGANPWNPTVPAFPPQLRQTFNAVYCKAVSLNPDCDPLPPQQHQQCRQGQEHQKCEQFCRKRIMALRCEGKHPDGMEQETEKELSASVHSTQAAADDLPSAGS